MNAWCLRRLLPLPRDQLCLFPATEGDSLTVIGNECGYRISIVGAGGAIFGDVARQCLRVKDAGYPLVTGTAGDIQVKDVEIGGIFNMGGAAVANFVSVMQAMR